MRGLLYYKMTQSVGESLIPFCLVLTNRKLFSKIVRAGFSQPRKQLINNFSRFLDLSREKVEKWLKENKIQPIRRAESLTVENWIDLTNDYCSLS